MAVSIIAERRAVYDRTADRSREQLSLASGNVASPPAQVAGGTYLVDITATAYGNIRVEMQRADGTWSPLVTRGAADMPIEVRLPAGAMVRAVLTGSTGASVTIARVPA
jgi:hypothetical protein